MVALAVLVTQISSDSANGKTDARLDAGVRTATNLYDEARADSGRVANDLARETADDPESIAAIRAGAVGDVVSLARIYADRDGISYVSIVDSEGHETVAGDSRPVATAEVDLVDDQGDQVGTITTSTTTRDQLLREIESTTGEEAALLGPRGPVSGHRRRRGGRPAAERRGAGPAARRRGGAGCGDRPAGRRAGEGGPVRTDRRRGLPRLATERRDRADRLLRRRPDRRRADPPLAAGLRARDARGREAHRRRRLLHPGPCQRPRRDGGAGERVQQDERAPRRPDGRAPAPAHRDREVDPEDRGCVRLRARPPGAARDPGGHRGRRLHGRLRAGGAQRPRRLGGRVGEGDRTGAGGGAGRREPGASRARAGGGLAGRRVRVRQLAGPARVDRGARRRDDDRPGGHAVQHGGTRRVPVSRRAGGGVGRERGPARARLRAGRDRRSHRARQQPRLPRRDGEGGGARRALPPRAFAC